MCSGAAIWNIWTSNAKRLVIDPDGGNDCSMVAIRRSALPFMWRAASRHSTMALSRIRRVALNEAFRRLLKLLLEFSKIPGDFAQFGIWNEAGDAPQEWESSNLRPSRGRGIR